MRRHLKAIAAVVVGAAVLVAVLLLPVESLLHRFLDAVAGLGPWAPVVIAAAYVPATVLFVPGSLLTFGAGFVAGVLWGTVAVSVGSTLGATLAFLLARHLLRDAVEARLVRHPRFRAVQQAVGRGGLRLVLLTRLSPVFPFTFLNYAFGVTAVRLRDYLLGSWLGMLPATVLYVAMGAAAKSLADAVAGHRHPGPAEIVLAVAGLLATVAVVVVVTRAARRALAEAAPGAAPAAGTGPADTHPADTRPGDGHSDPGARR